MSSLLCWTILLTTLIVLGIHFNTTPRRVPPREDPGFAIFGFLPNYRFEGAALEFMSAHVTHLCLFGSEADFNTGGLILRLPDPEDVRSAKEAAPNTKFIVGFGGAGRSEFFAKVLKSEGKRKRFTKELVGLVTGGGFHGVELNWMYPASESEIAALEKVVRDVRRGCEPGGVYVSMAVPADAQFVKRLSRMSFDHLHVMAYQVSIPLVPGTMKTLMKTLSREISNPNRLTLGLPFYGTVLGKNTAITYEEIFTTKTGFGATAFETPDILAQKIAIARELGLGGISIWELGQDCRVRPMRNRHPKTCPMGESDSLLMAVRKAVDDSRPREVGL